MNAWVRDLQATYGARVVDVLAGTKMEAAPKEHGKNMGIHVMPPVPLCALPDPRNKVALHLHLHTEIKLHLHLHLHLHTHLHLHLP
jgi:hypothetical protein